MVNDSSLVRDGADGAVEELAAQLFSLSRVLRSRIQRAISASGRPARGDAPVLRALVEQGPMRPGQLAERLNIGASAISRHLTVLVDEELVSRRSDPADRRAELVEITEAGRARLDELKQLYVAMMREHFAAWESERLQQATQTLRELSQSLAKTPQPSAAGATAEDAR